MQPSQSKPSTPDNEHWLDNPTKLRNRGFILLGLCVILCGLAIWLLPKSKFLWIKLGPIGDQFGGTTGPIITFVGTILTFLTLLAQVRANYIISSRLQRDDVEKTAQTIKRNLEENSRELRQFWADIEHFISSFNGITRIGEGIFESPLKGRAAFKAYSRFIYIQSTFTEIGKQYIPTKPNDQYHQYWAAIKLFKRYFKLLSSSDLYSHEKEILIQIKEAELIDMVFIDVPIYHEELQMHEIYRPVYRDIMEIFALMQDILLENGNSIPNNFKYSSAKRH